MVSYYDEVEIEDFAWDALKKVFHFPCPCGDRFEISKLDLRDGDDIAKCPSCSLIVRVIYDPLEYEDYEPSDEEDDQGEVSDVDSPSSTVSFHSANDGAEVEVKDFEAEETKAGVDEVTKGLGLVQVA